MREPTANTFNPPPLGHDNFGLNQSKIMNVIDSKSLERDAGGKPDSTFPHPALGHDQLIMRQNKEHACFNLKRSWSKRLALCAAERTSLWPSRRAFFST
jgi:hypothetical protein